VGEIRLSLGDAGFLTGVAANIVLGQIPDLTGAPAEGRAALSKALHVILHPGTIDIASLVTGLSALLALALLARTRLRIVGALIALVLPTVALLLLRNNSVQLVEDVGNISRQDCRCRLCPTSARCQPTSLPRRFP
jgi:sulfate permease, SulP family